MQPATTIQYFRMFGHRANAITTAGWGGVCPWPAARTSPEAAQKGRRFGSPISTRCSRTSRLTTGSCTIVDEDYPDATTWPKEHRDRLIEMIGRWWAEAGRYQVLASSTAASSNGLNVERPTIAPPRNRFVLYPGGSGVPFTATPKLYNRPWSITADVVIPPAGRKGVLLARGGRTGGYNLLRQRIRRLHFLYNWLGRDRFWVHSQQDDSGGRRRAALPSSSDREARPCPGKGCRHAPALHQTARSLAASICPTRF